MILCAGFGNATEGVGDDFLGQVRRVMGVAGGNFFERLGLLLGRSGCTRRRARGQMDASYNAQSLRRPLISSTVPMNN